MEKSSEISMRMSNEYRSICLRIAVPCFLIVVTWIWKNNESGLSWWCNQLAWNLLICLYTSIFYNFNDDVYYSSFHPLFLGACIWHGVLSLLNNDGIDIVREGISANGILFYWWCSYSYWWVMTRDASLILISTGALIGLKYSRLFNTSLPPCRISILDDDPSWDFVLETNASIRRWRERRFWCILRRVVIFRGTKNHRRRRHRQNSRYRDHQHPRHRYMRRF